MSSLLDPRFLTGLLSEVGRLCAWLALLALLFVPVERLFALRPRRLFSRSLPQDLGYYFISSLVPGMLLAVPLSLAAYGAHWLVPWRIQVFIAGCPIWERALAGLVISEIGFYWGHRWAHAIPFLWRFHSVHHSAKQIYFLISSRAHPIDNAFIRMCGLVPVALLGVATPLTRDGGTVAAILVLALTLWGFFIHANVRWRLGPLEWIVATPHFHHWHHTLGDQRNLNYASMLPVMDWLFGTFHLPSKEWPRTYGIDTEMSPTLLGQLVEPLLPPAANVLTQQPRS
jgi:sterol desaturase/sphingolipid hydroxylase (fatty acid hydroxylase superfamily)